MENTEQQELLDYISKILDMTKAGKIEWARANPTTYIWTKTVGTVPSRIVLQKVQRQEPFKPDPTHISVRVIPGFIFQVLDLRSNAQMITINSTEEAIYNASLSQLFDYISQNISRRGIDFLKNLLEA